MKRPYTTYFNPNAQEYKKIVLTSKSSLNNIIMSSREFHTCSSEDDKNSNTVTVFAPPDLVDKAVRSSLDDSFAIEEVCDVDPSNYPEYLSIRIRGEVPIITQYADQLTEFDPRYYKVGNSLLLSPTSLSDEEIRTGIQDGENLTMFGNLAPLETILELGETDCLDLEWEGGERFIGIPKLIELGKRYINKFGSDEVYVKYGGPLFVPRKGRPHGSFGLDAIYFCMDEFNQEIQSWVETQLISDQPDKQTPDEYNIVKSDDDHNPNNLCYIRAWWD